MIAIDLSTQQALDADPRTIQQLNTKYSLIFIIIKNNTIQQFKCKAIKFTA